MLLPIEVQSSVVFKSGSRSEDATEATASARTLRKLHHISEAGPIEFSPDYVAGDSIMSIKIGLGSSRALQYNIIYDVGRGEFRESRAALYILLREERGVPSE